MRLLSHFTLQRAVEYGMYIPEIFPAQNEWHEWSRPRIVQGAPPTLVNLQACLPGDFLLSLSILHALFSLFGAFVCSGARVKNRTQAKYNAYAGTICPE